LKNQLKYNNETIGNLKEYKLDDNGNMEMLKFLIYDKSWYDIIWYNGFIEHLKKSVSVTLDKNPDLIVMENNKLFQIELVEDGELYLILRLM